MSSNTTFLPISYGDFLPFGRTKQAPKKRKKTKRQDEKTQKNIERKNRQKQLDQKIYSAREVREINKQIVVPKEIRFADQIEQQEKEKRYFQEELYYYTDYEEFNYRKEEDEKYPDARGYSNEKLWCSGCNSFSCPNANAYGFDCFGKSARKTHKCTGCKRTNCANYESYGFDCLGNHP